MRQAVIYLLVLFSLVARPPLQAADGGPTPKDIEHFEKHVRPLLVERCEKCHGAKKQMSGFRVDSREAMVKGGEIGLVLAPGKVEASDLLKAVRHEGEVKMPPDERLTAQEVAV